MFLSGPGDLNYFVCKLSLETWLAGAQIFKGQQTNMEN